MKFRINYLSISIWIVSFQIISFFSSFLSRGNRDWYNSIEKSSFSPPGYVFGIVWPILYVTLAIAGYFIWQNRSNYRSLLTIFMVQMAFNWLWSPVFFGMKSIELSVVLLAAITIMILVMIWKLYKLKNPIFYLLLPYFFWVCFAYYLNLAVFILN